MGLMLAANVDMTKAMILTHGECERSSIYLGVLLGGWCREEGKIRDPKFKTF
jgi:hypothetical protein